MTQSTLTGTAAVVALTWLVYLLDTEAWPGIVLPWLVSAAGLLNLAVTLTRPSWKVTAVRWLQRRAVNPTVKAGLRVGVNPLGVTLVETRGRRSGQPRVNPVGVARVGDVVWLIAEHGHRAGYVRNIAEDPRVRVRLREAGKHTWRTGTAHLEPTDDPLARQRRMCGINPLRWLNAMMVRTLGAELLSVRIEVDPMDVAPGGPGSRYLPQPQVSPQPQRHPLSSQQPHPSWQQVESPASPDCPEPLIAESRQKQEASIGTSATAVASRS